MYVIRQFGAAVLFDPRLLAKLLRVKLALFTKSVKKMEIKQLLLSVFALELLFRMKNT